MSHLSNPWRRPWQIKSGHLAYDNAWISVYHDDVLTPSGQDGIYGMVHFKNYAVAVIPIDAEGYTYLVGQYRYPIGRWSWEVPEGGCPVGTDPRVTARRELKEETGLVATELIDLGTCHLSNSVSDEMGYFYLAQNLRIGPASPEDTEELVVERVPFEEAINMAHHGAITDSMSIIALMRAERWLHKSRSTSDPTNN